MQLEIKCQATFCNDWPKFQVQFNDTVLFDHYVQSLTDLRFDIEPEAHNRLILRHHGKFFGENNRWDTDSTHDRAVYLLDVKFDSISLGPEILDHVWFHTEWSDLQRRDNDPVFLQQYDRFCSSRQMNFNGYFEIEFTTPVLDWLILTKYKKTSSSAAASYFSAYDQRWHYEKDRAILDEIKGLMNFD